MDSFVNDRRRSPRFNCGGRARIVCLPSEGAIVSGNLRNLSLGGICVDTTRPVDLGERIEVLVCVNAASFRTLGLVKATLQGRRACMEFTRMSAGSRGLLDDLVSQLARHQKVMAALRSERPEPASDLFHQLREAGLGAAVSSNRLISLRIQQEDKDVQPLVTPREREEALADSPILINVDLFG